jgi:putative peptidoglycan lipid II flippase
MPPMNLLRVLATVSGITLLSRITGLAREVLFATYFGANAQFDAFRVAFLIPNLLRRLFAEGAFAQAFVPILGEFKVRRGEEETRKLIDHTATVLTAVLVVVTVIGIIAAPLLVYLTASGLKYEEGTFRLAVLMTRLMFPYILLISLVAAASGVLNTWRQFSIPAFTPVLLNVAFIFTAVAFYRICNPPIIALALGPVLGGILQLGIQIRPLIRIGMLPRLSLHLKTAFADSGVRRVMRQMGPAIFAVSIAQLSLVINVNIATWLGPGSVSWINYADRLMEFPTALLGVGLATILTPSLSQARARGDHDEYGALLDWGMRLTVMFALPCALALWLIALPLTATLYGHGEFDALAVVKTAQAVTAYGVGLIGLIMVKILAPGFYASQDIRTPVKIGILVLIATQLMNLVFVPLFAHAGLALSTSLGACANAGLLYWGLKRRGAIKTMPGWPLFLMRVGLALLVLAGILWWGNREFDWIALKSEGIKRVGLLFFVIALGALSYLSTLFATGIRLEYFKRRI